MSVGHVDRVGHVGRVSRVGGHVIRVARVGSRFGGRVVHIGWSCQSCWSRLVVCLASRKKYA